MRDPLASHSWPWTLFCVAAFLVALVPALAELWK